MVSASTPVVSCFPPLSAVRPSPSQLSADNGSGVRWGAKGIKDLLLEFMLGGDLNLQICFTDILNE